MNEHDDDTFAGFARRFARIESEVKDPPALRRVRGASAPSVARWSLTGLTTVLALVGAIAVLGPFIAGRSSGLPTSTSPVVIGATSPTAAAPAVTCGRIPADSCDRAIDLVRDGHQSEVVHASAIVVDDVCPPTVICDRLYPFDSIVVIVAAEGVLGDPLTLRVFGTDGPESVRAWQGGLPRHVVLLLPGAPVPSVAQPTVDPSVVGVPTQAPEPSGSPRPCPAALIEGALVTDERWGLVIEDADGLRRKILWPHGYAARVGSRLALLDASGSIVAYEGDLVRVGGGETGSSGTWLGCGGITVVPGG